MAMSIAETIDPTEEPVIRRFQVKPLDPRSVDPARVAVRYDRRSDTLLMHLFGRDRNAVSIPREDHLSWLVDLETEDVVGFHIEGFLAGAVEDDPRLIELLNYAEPRGITPAEISALRRDAMGIRQRLAAWSRSVSGRTPQEQKRRAVSAFVDAVRSRQRPSPSPSPS